MDIAKLLTQDLEEYKALKSESEPIVDKIRLVEDSGTLNGQPVTMWMSPKCELGYNPAFVKNLTDTERKAVIDHEIRHYMNGHFLRFRQLEKIKGKINPIIANIGMDLEINSDIKGLPITGVFPSTFGFKPNLAFEEYIELLLRLPKFNIDGKILGNDMKFSAAETEAILDEIIQEEILEEVAERKAIDRWTGGGIGKTKIKTAPPINIFNYVKALVARMTDQPIQGFDHTNYSRFRRALPKIPRFQTNSYRPEVKVAFVVDTSGSRSNSMINLSLSRIFYTLQSLDECSIVGDLYFVDAAVCKTVRLNTSRDIPKEFKGRGGTRMDIVFPELDKQRYRYDLVIFITDALLAGDDLKTIPPKYKQKVVMGVDANYYKDTQKQFKFPIFCL
jgi:predicted metal-dependent peptidase